MLILDEREFVLPDVIPTVEEIIGFCTFVMNMTFRIEDFYENEILQMTRTLVYEIELGLSVEELIRKYFRILEIINKSAARFDN